MKKKHLVIVGVIILSAIVILGLYQTFALSGDIAKDTNGYYNVTVTDGTTVTVPAGSTKTVYYKLTNTNKGIVKYGIGYSGTNITVEYFNDTQDPVTGTVDYGKSKYIKLFVQNSGTTSSTATLSTILGYENGGDLIVPSGVTLISESHKDLESFNLTIQKDTGVNSIYYKVNGSSTYSATRDSSITLKVISGSNYYYYGVPHYGYKMDSCTKDSPCSGIMGDSDVNKTLSTTKLPTYTVTIKKTLDGGTATTLETVSVVSNGSYSTTYIGGPYYTFESVSCTNGQTATIKDVYTSGTIVVDGDFNITNVTNNTVCTIYISS